MVHRSAQGGRHRFVKVSGCGANSVFQHFADPNNFFKGAVQFARKGVSPHVYHFHKQNIAPAVVDSMPLVKTSGGSLSGGGKKQLKGMTGAVKALAKLSLIPPGGNGALPPAKDFWKEEKTSKGEGVKKKGKKSIIP